MSSVAEALYVYGVLPAAEDESVLDEGGTILSGTVPGVAQPVALVGVAEKGFASVELVVEGEGGMRCVRDCDVVGCYESGVGLGRGI